MIQNKAQVELKVRNTFSKREILKVGKEEERQRENHGDRNIHVDVERGRIMSYFLYFSVYYINLN